MSILCLSDIHWEAQERRIVKTDGIHEEVRDINILKRLKAEIDEVSPSLVLFGGDVINDGGNKEEHVTDFLELLDYLEELETPSFTIQGNHDAYSNYEAVVDHIRGLDFAEEISEKVVEFDDLSILGVPYKYTNDLGRARKISEEFPATVDIVLAHAASRRRVWLFELDTDYIITGHFGSQVCRIQNQVFASLHSYPGTHIVLNPRDGELSYIRSSASNASSDERYASRVRVKTDGLEWLSDESGRESADLGGLDGSDFGKRVEALISAKREVEDVDAKQERVIIEGLLEMGVPKTHIREYIARYDFL